MLIPFKFAATYRYRMAVPARVFSRQDAMLIAGIIQDEIGGEVCTPEWAQAAADRIVCALSNPEQTADER